MSGSLTEQEVWNAVFDSTDNRLTTDYSSGGSDVYLMESGDVYLMEDGTGNYLLE